MNTGSFLAHIKTDNIYKGIAEDVETRLGKSNFELGRPLPKGKNKEVTGLMKDKVVGEIMKKFVALTAKTCCYLKDNKCKRTKNKKENWKRKYKFENHKNCLEATQFENKLKLSRNKSNWRR